jgi:hypothetical protein
LGGGVIGCLQEVVRGVAAATKGSIAVAACSGGWAVCRAGPSIVEAHPALAWAAAAEEAAGVVGGCEHATVYVYHSCACALCHRSIGYVLLLGGGPH